MPNVSATPDDIKAMRKHLEEKGESGLSDAEIAKRVEAQNGLNSLSKEKYDKLQGNVSKKKKNSLLDFATKQK